MRTNYIWLLAFSVISFTACESDDTRLADPIFEETTAVEYTNGNADFSSFVAVGNSLTAGYSDGALFAKGQNVSFPNILANQFAVVGGGNFTQPLMNDDIGGFVLGGNPILHPITGANLFPPRLIFDTAAQVPVTYPAPSTTELMTTIPGPYNNMGVPGAKVGHLLAPGFGNMTNFPNANPYFIRMASQPNATVLEDALAMNPTFFSLWIGNNDVLGYAASGGDGSNPITDTATFTGAYNMVVSALVSASPNGIVANIPNVTDTPHFTVVPHNPIPLDAPTAGAVNAAYAAYNAGVQSLVGVPPVNLTQEEADSRMINFAEGSNNAVVIMDEDLSDLTIYNPALIGMRQATSEDLIVLTASSFIGTLADPGNPMSVNGVAIPLGDKWVLTPSEQEEIATATQAFNQVIADAAAANNLPLFDANAFLSQAATTGITSGSVTVTSDFVTGGAFSLDGVHLSPRGYAIVANKMIELINTTYNANVPKVNPANYTGVYIN